MTVSNQPTGSATSPRPVLVGVDGSERNHAAVRWSALEAEHRGVPLRLMCVIDEYSVLSPELKVRSVTPAATAALERAREIAAATSPNLPVETTSTSGMPASELARASDHCDMLVLGRHGAGGFRELLLGSTTTVAASQAACTVVVVPERWTAEDRGPVVVGLTDVDAGPVLEQALLEAERRYTPVRAIHAWDIHPELSWDAALAYGDLSEFERGVRSRLTEAVAPWTAKHPDVSLDLQVRREHPIAALRGAARGAALVVVGAHRPRVRSFSGHQRLGSVARGVLHHVDAPVMVVRTR